MDRRLNQMRAEGTEFRTGVDVGVDVTADELRSAYDAVVLAGGATAWRELPAPGRELSGVHQAMEYLPPANQAQEGDLASSPISVEGKNVVIIGGGDTGADCLGTAHRQGAASVTQLEIMLTPPNTRPQDQPWPTYPLMYRSAAAHEQGVERTYSVNTQEFVGDEQGRLRALRLVDVRREQGSFVPIDDTERELPCQLALLALGFTGPEHSELLSDLDLELARRGTVARDTSYMTNVDGVFSAGDNGPRAVTDRVGHRRRMCRRRRRRPLSHRTSRGALADRPHRPAPGITTEPTGG